MSYVREKAEEIRDESDENVDVEEIVEEMERLSEYIPEEEAYSELRSTYVENSGGSTGEDIGEVTLEEIAEGGLTADIPAVEVVDVWEPRSDKVRQTGLVADETDQVKYTEFTGGDQRVLEEGDVVSLSNVETDEYNGQYNVILREETNIEPVDETLDTGSANEIEFMAPIVAVTEGGLLIKRCAVEGCTWVVTDRNCPEHPDAGSERDMRVKAVADEAGESHRLIFDREMAEEITGIDMDTAVEMFTEHMSREHIASEVRSELLGKYYVFRGTEVNGNVLVDDFEIVERDTEEAAQELLNKLDQLGI